jgi:hypothetical protein
VTRSRKRIRNGSTAVTPPPLEETAECKGKWIKASVGQDGKFTVTNGRNGFSKNYTAR